MIRVKKTYYLDRQAQRICNVRQKLILGIWIKLLTVLALVEVSTFAWHALIIKKFGSDMVLHVVKHVEVILQVTGPRVG